MKYEIEAPVKKRKGFFERAYDVACSAILGVVMAGAGAWGLLQVDNLATAYAYKTPRAISTEDGSISCVLWREEMDCIENDDMPEPELELTYEEAVDLLKEVLPRT